MKYINKLFGVFGALCAVLALNACTEEVDYSSAEVPAGAQVYFANTLGTTIELDQNATSFSVELRRVNTDTEVSVPITASGASSSFTIPSAVSFAAGAEVANVNISYKSSEMEYDDFCTITLSIGDETLTSPYGETSYTFSAGIPAPWTTLGMATYVDDFVTTLFGVENVQYMVEIQENDIIPGYYRLVNPYGAAYPYNAAGDYDASKDYFLEIHAEDPTAVYIPVQGVGCDWGYGEWYMGSMAGYYINGGNAIEDVKAAGYCGTFENGVFTFPTGTLLFGMADYNDGGLYPANNGGAFRIAMPGVQLTDYTIGIAYAGKYTDAKDVDAGVLAQITQVGDDVESVRIALVEGEDVNAAIAGVLDESIPSVEVAPAIASLQLPFNAAPVDGKYTLVALSYAGGEPQEVAYATFKYTSAANAETWTDVYAGTFTYSLWWAADEEGTPLEVPGYTLSVSDQDQTRWKIAGWGGNGVDFIFTWNQETGEVYVPEVEVDTHPQYGAVYITDVVTYTGGTDYGYSFLDEETLTFNFALVYYCADGLFGNGYETFQITGYAQADAASTRALTRGVADTEFGKMMVNCWNANKNVRKLKLIRKGTEPLPALK